MPAFIFLCLVSMVEWFAIGSPNVTMGGIAKVLLTLIAATLILMSLSGNGNEMEN